MTIQQLIIILGQFPPTSQVFHHHIYYDEDGYEFNIKTIPRLDFEHNAAEPHLLIKAGEFVEDRQ